MAESYQDIMARLNGPTQQEEPKAANDFASYVRTLLENPNPQGGMLGDAAGYYADPFRKQNTINQAILDEELRKKQEAEKAAAEAAAEAAAASSGGMFSPPPRSGGGGNYEGPNLTQAQMDYFDNETAFERDVRMNDLMRTMIEGVGVGVLGLPGMLVQQPAPIYSGLTDYSTRSPDAIRQQVEQQRTLQAAVMADEQRKREAAQAEAARVAAAQAEAARVAAAQQEAARVAAAQRSFEAQRAREEAAARASGRGSAGGSSISQSAIDAANRSRDPIGSLSASQGWSGSYGGGGGISGGDYGGGLTM